MTQNNNSGHGIDDLPDNPEDQINTIRQAYQDKTPWIAKGSIRGGGEFVQSGFSATHFPLELIQNADDENADEILFEFDSARGQLRVFDDGEGFDKNGVVAVSQQGQSRKESDEEIGFMGIGFKSLFEVCDCVEVHSNDYHFAFELANDDGGDDTVPGFLLPKWIGSDSVHGPRFTDDEFGREFNTAIVGHLSADKEDILPAFESSNLSPSVFLFLNSLERVRIRSDGAVERTLRGQWRAATAHPNIDINDSNDCYIEALEEADDVSLPENIADPVRVQEIHDGDEQQTYIMFRNEWEPDTVARPQFREDLTRSELFVAIQYDGDGLCESDGSIRLSPVHSYLPLSTFNDLDIDFVVHADFDLTLNREDIQRGSPWNDEVVKHLRKQVLQPVATAVANHDQWHTDLEVVVPKTRDGEGIIHEDLLGEYIRELKEKALFQPVGEESPGYVPVSNATAVTDSVIDVFDLQTVREIQSGWPVIEFQKEALDRLSSRRIESAEVHNVLGNLPSEQLEDRHIDWFRMAFEEVAAVAYKGEDNIGVTDDWDLEGIQKVFKNEIVPTEDDGLKPVLKGFRSDWDDEEIRTPPPRGYGSLADEAAGLTSFSLVSGELFKDEGGTFVRNFFDALGAEELSTAELLASVPEEGLAGVNERDILKAYADNDAVSEATTQWLRTVGIDSPVQSVLVQEIQSEDSTGKPEDIDEPLQKVVSSNWWRLSQEGKRESLRYILAVEDRSAAEFEEINRLPTASGQWEDPGRLVFPSQYEPKYDYEMVHAEFPKVFQKHTRGFVDPELIDGDPTEWRELLRDIGVCNTDGNENQNNIVSTLSGYVGQAYACNWLEEQGRTIEQRDEYGESTGKDIVDSDGNYYEVKSTVNSSTGEIDIEGQQFAELERSRTTTYTFYVVAVTNSLDEPVIRDCSTAEEIMRAKGSVAYNPSNTPDFDGF
ncbi:sacsin N-terminal ATP-binding-like domain-containing protein [Natronorubrum thiooxidans]|uniref:Histidine kinase-, DNA gyrase B-, and HSP90-like ATPase n=1 Tax=Natronorubrum thiooxidans TaxID=308853 RepID=A0A1N7H9A2_9EURY|nr:ATP-binding protein [Natronorubrum thiooxidans]SIS21280.1 Histidine kinase-, DNA gyrase B-, and HSP90-like ATPase [Natronorubrum thiooxidans]